MTLFGEIKKWFNITQLAVTNLAFTNIFIRRAIISKVKTIDTIKQEFDEFLSKKFKNKK